MREGAILFLFFRITSEGQLMKENFPMRLSQAVASSLNVQSDFLSHGFHISECGGPTVKNFSLWILASKGVLESISCGY